MPRCPLKLISSPSGPWVIDTPGVSVRRSSNLRPSTGVELTVSSFSVDDDSVLVTSMIGTSVTTICCATAETFRVTGIEIVWPTVKSTFLLQDSREARLADGEGVAPRRKTQEGEMTVCIRGIQLDVIVTNSLLLRSRPRRFRPSHPQHLPARSRSDLRLRPPGRGKPQRKCQHKERTQQFSHFSPPDITTLFPTSQRIPQKGRGGSHNNCCDAVYVGTVPKHKYATVETFRDANQFWMESIGFTESHHRRIALSTLKCGGL